MKQKIFIFFIALFGGYVLLFALSPFAKDLIARKIKTSLAAKEVSLAGFRLDPLGSALLRGIKIKSNVQDIEAEKVAVKFNWLGLLKKEVREVSFKNARASIILKDEAFDQFLKSSGNSSSSKNFSIGTLEVSGLSLAVQSRKFNFKSESSFKIDIPRQTILSLDLRVSSLTSGNISFEDLAITIPSSAAEGRLSLKNAKFNKVRFENIESKLIFKDKILLLEPLSASLFTGNISGHLKLALEQKWAYNLELNFKDLEIPSLIKDFELENKATMTGKLSGTALVQGNLSGMSSLSGNLAADPEGGDLVITDKAFLQRLADNTKQPLVIIEAGFKEYHYNTASIKLSMAEKNLGLRLLLDGEKGKRDLDVTLHDIL